MTRIDLAALRQHIGTRISDNDVAAEGSTQGHRRHLRS